MKNLHILGKVLNIYFNFWQETGQNIDKLSNIHLYGALGSGHPEARKCIKETKNLSKLANVTKASKIIRESFISGCNLNL